MTNLTVSVKHKIPQFVLLGHQTTVYESHRATLANTEVVSGHRTESPSGVGAEVANTPELCHPQHAMVLKDLAATSTTKSSTTLAFPKNCRSVLTQSILQNNSWTYFSRLINVVNSKIGRGGGGNNNAIYWYDTYSYTSAIHRLQKIVRHTERSHSLRTPNWAYAWMPSYLPYKGIYKSGHMSSFGFKNTSVLMHPYTPFTCKRWLHSRSNHRPSAMLGLLKDQVRTY